MRIEDGQGAGRYAGVNSDNMLKVRAVSSSLEHFVNRVDGDAYNVVFEQTNAASGDECIFYLENEHSDKDLIIEGLDISVDQAAEIYAKLGDSGTVSGSPTTLTPVNLNTGSGLEADATCYRDDDMGGLSGGSEFWRFVFRAANDTEPINFEQDVVLTENGVFTLYCDTASTTANITVIFHFEES